MGSSALIKQLHFIYLPFLDLPCIHLLLMFLSWLQSICSMDTIFEIGQ
jgi:hypothetical protein